MDERTKDFISTHMSHITNWAYNCLKKENSNAEQFQLPGGTIKVIKSGEFNDKLEDKR